MLSDGISVLAHGATAEARGGCTTGNGGVIDLSGARVSLHGKVDTRAPHGRSGNFLLDPCCVTIVDTCGNRDNCLVTCCGSVAGTNAQIATVSATEINCISNTTNICLQGCKIFLNNTCQVPIALGVGAAGTGASITLKAGAGGITNSGNPAIACLSGNTFTGGIGAQLCGAITLSSTGPVSIRGYNLSTQRGKICVTGAGGVTVGALTARCCAPCGLLKSGNVVVTNNTSGNLLRYG